VATGLGEPAKPSVVVDNGPAKPQVADVLIDTGRPDYGTDWERPAIIRQSERGRAAQSRVALEREVDQMEWIDIPAFLRRQAD
jgi:hypothetical protein